MKKSNFKPAEVRSGEKDWGYINIIDTLAVKFDMPVMVINGISDGPTFTVTAGLYPLEFCGVEAASRLYQQLDPDEISGKLVIIPVVNMPILQFRTPMFALTKSLSPMDGKDITKVFPGDPEGTVTDVLAYKLFNDVILGSNYHVDLRGGDIDESHLQHTIFLQNGTPIDETLKTMAQVFGLKYCLPSRPDISHTMPGTLVYETIIRGIPSIISESGLGFNTQPSDDEVNGHVIGVMNLMKHYNMIEGKLVKPDKQYYLEPDRVRILASLPGIFKHIYDQAEEIRKGEVIGTICDLDGEVLSAVTAPCDAIIHEMMPRRLVYTGDRIYSLAVVAQETEYSLDSIH